MATFGKLSNKTREILRPPKTVLLPAGSALFYQIPRAVKAQQPASKNARKKKSNQPPARPAQQPAPARQPPVARHQVEEKKNGVVGQNGHSLRPNTTPGRESTPSYGSRSSNLFPAAPRHNTPPPREEKPVQRSAPPVRPAQPPATQQESKPHPPERRNTAAPPPQEKNGRVTPPNEGSTRGGASFDRRSAWLPSNPPNRAGVPPVRPAQAPMGPGRKDEQPQPTTPPENRPYRNGERPAQNEPFDRASSPVRPAAEAPRQNRFAGEGTPSTGTQQRAPAPSELSAAALNRILSRYSDLPAQSSLLGLCDDGLPVMLDLFDPSPGAMAIIGDERESQLEMLRNVVASAAMRNSPRALQFVVLTMQPESWQQWIDERGFTRHSLGVAPAKEETAREWILRLADWTEERRTGQRSGPPVLFVMDTLSFLPRLELDARLNFDWLAKEGPIAAIWPIATISTDLASSLGSRLAAFGSKVLGYTDDPSLYVRVANVDPSETAGFRKRGEFAVRVSGNWLRFRLPK